MWPVLIMPALGRQDDCCKFEASQGSKFQANLDFLKTLSQIDRDEKRGWKGEGGGRREGGKEINLILMLSCLPLNSPPPLLVHQRDREGAVRRSLVCSDAPSPRPKLETLTAFGRGCRVSPTFLFISPCLPSSLL